jgi:hypothetical protein
MAQIVHQSTMRYQHDEHGNGKGRRIECRNEAKEANENKGKEVIHNKGKQGIHDEGDGD